MTKQEALDMVLKMLSDGEIEHEFEGVPMIWSKVDILNTTGNFRIKPAKLFDVEIPRPLTKEELEDMNYNETVFTIALWNESGVGSITAKIARENFSPHSVIYKTPGEVMEAIKALRNV